MKRRTFLKSAGQAVVATAVLTTSTYGLNTADEMSLIKTLKPSKRMTLAEFASDPTRLYYVEKTNGWTVVMLGKDIVGTIKAFPVASSI